MKLTLVLVLLVCSWTLWRSESSEAAPTRPNILFLLTDDQRADTIQALGNRQIQTPNLDRLAGEGLAFERAYIMGALQGAVCVPSRAMLLSGRTLFRVPDNLRGVETWPQKLRQAGYRTFITGKWHNQAPALLAAFEAGEAVFLGGMGDQFRVPVQDIRPPGTLGSKSTNDLFSAELFATSAVRFLGSLEDDRPFCLYVAFTTPHDPRTTPRGFQQVYASSKPPLPPNFLPEHPFDNGELKVRDEQLLPWPRTEAAVRQELADYYASITATDLQIGRILEALRASGRYENTVVVFAGDNGLAIGSHGLLGKQNLYEHSMRVPLILAGPGIVRGQRSDAFCYLLDLAPTLCELAGATAPSGHEGHSLVPLLGRGQGVGREAIFTAYRDLQRSVRDERWKLIHYPRIGRTQLFDLADDAQETRDLAGLPRYAGPEETLRARLAAMQGSLGDPIRAKPAAR